MISASVQVVPAPRRSVRSFVGWVAQSCDPGAQVLDIGAGCSRSGPLTPLTARRAYLVGVDPDPSIRRNSVLSERHEMTLEAFATEHEAVFDVAFAAYVAEHVSDPAAFVGGCARVLKPGGSLFVLTLNVRQYFGATTRALARVGLSDRLLEAMKGHAEVHDHHFRPEYRLNSIPTVRRHLDHAGFRSVEFRCYDDTARYQWYLPSGLQWFPPAYTRLAYAVGSAQLMGHLSFRAVR